MRLILAMMLMMKRIMLVMFRDDPLNGFACSNGILSSGCSIDVSYGVGDDHGRNDEKLITI